MCKKLEFDNDDLLGDAFASTDNILLDISVVGFDNLIKGKYSFFKKNVLLWEGSLRTDLEIMVSFTPNEKTSYFYLLSFDSEKSLNKRVIIDLPINDTLIDNQAQKGALFWSSDVGVNLMLPSNSQIHFQLVGIHQNVLFNYLNRESLIRMKIPFLNKKNNIPIFYFSNIYYIFENLLFNTIVTKKTQNEISYVGDLMINFLASAGEESAQLQVPFKNFYSILLIEKMIRKLPVTKELNIELLGETFQYSSRVLNRLFRQVFGMGIVKYHRYIHMKYAKWLIEENQMKIEEVSKKMGFRTTSLFSQAFKRYFPQAMFKRRLK